MRRGSRSTPAPPSRVRGERRRVRRGATSPTARRSAAALDGEPTSSSTPPPTCASGARWTTSFASTSAAPRNVLDAAEAAGADRVVHISSVVVYGYESPSEQDEDASAAPTGSPTSTPRAPPTRSPAPRRGRDPPRRRLRPGLGAVDAAPARAREVGQLAVPGDGDGLMLPLYVDDLVEAVVLGLSRASRDAPTRPGTAAPVTFEDYFNRLADAGRRAPRPPRPAAAARWRRPQPMERVRGCAARPPPSRRTR